jgi:hypothetical protein
LVIDGDEVADVSTFVARSAIAGSAEDEANDLAVSLVIGTTQEPTIANDGLVNRRVQSSPSSRSSPMRSRPLIQPPQRSASIRRCARSRSNPPR